MPQLSLKQVTSSQFNATLYLVLMCIQIVAIEGYGISPIKVVLMALAPLLFILKTPYINKALIWGMLYWMVCYFVAAFHGNMRFSTVGYLGMFVVTYIVFYSLVYSGAFTIEYFVKLLRILILLFGLVLLMQQLAMVIGVYSFPIINLTNQHFLSLTKLPSLTIEPSHTARILTVMILAYWRCHEIVAGGERITFKEIFSSKHKWVTISFLWTMLTMGSATSFIGMGILSLYFLQRRTLIYVLPVLLILFFVGRSLELEQMDRAIRVIQATTTLDSETMIETDHSASARVTALINTITELDIFAIDTWIGHGIDYTKNLGDYNVWLRKSKIGGINEYGLLSFILMQIIVYTCVIRRIISLESFFWIFLFNATLSNVAYIWGAVMIFTAVRFFQIQKEQGLLEFENNTAYSTM